jgi:hypothetical protein
MDQKVFVTEKVEGTNFSVMFDPLTKAQWVNQRTKTIVPKEGAEHTFWKAAKRQRLLEFAQILAERVGKRVAVYGELLGPGIQKNIYGLKEHKVLLYDVKVGMDWMPPEQFVSGVSAFYDLMGELVPIVPIISRDKTLREWLAEQGGKTVKEASNGKSMLAPRAREGIVIRPLAEQHVRSEDPMGFSGRLVIKQRSPEYLAKSET